MAKFNLYAHETPPTYRAAARRSQGFTPGWWAVAALIVGMVFFATFAIAGL